MNLRDLTDVFGSLSEAHRPIRLRLSLAGHVTDDLLLIKHVTGVETICGGFKYRLLCVSLRADLPLKQFIAVPVELQFVTVFRQTGYEHQSSYNDPLAIASTLYSIVRISQAANWKC